MSQKNKDTDTGTHQSPKTEEVYLEKKVLRQSCSHSGFNNQFNLRLLSDSVFVRLRCKRYLFISYSVLFLCNSFFLFSQWGSSADVGSATPGYRFWASISLIRQIFHRLVH